MLRVLVVKKLAQLNMATVGKFRGAQGEGSLTITLLFITFGNSN